MHPGGNVKAVVVVCSKYDVVVADVVESVVVVSKILQFEILVYIQFLNENKNK